MNVETKNTRVFARQPLAALGKLTVGALVGSAVLCGVLTLLIGADGIGLLILAAILLLGAVLVATGIRWTPLLGTLLGVGLLTVFFSVPYVSYHLTNPKEAFGFFVVIVLIIACLVVALGASISAAVQNYREQERQAPRWLTSALTGVIGIVLGAILIAAVAQPGTTTTTTTGGEPTVHMGPGSFLQSSVTVPKGSKLLLVDDGSFTHIIANGTWVNSAPQTKQEPGAPTVNNVQVSGGSVEIGPFTTAGTYHIYCTVHQGMNLTVIVQ
jgi:plastocyanin